VSRRSYFKIIAEVLETAREGAKKTDILRCCNLEHSKGERLLPRLLDRGLLNKGISYRTTETGLHFIKAYQNLELLLKEN
jgi:predicted transcriptional regulator